MATRGKNRKAIEADALIVGGGLVGGVSAIALASAGISSVVVERGNPAEQMDVAFDGRAFAIAYATRRMLQTLGIWEGIADPSPILDIRVSEKGSRHFLHFNDGEGGDEPFGHMVEARHMRRAIHARLKDMGEIQMLAPTELTGLIRGESGVRAFLADGREISARLVIAADGRNSKVRKDAGIRTTGWSYGQHGIVCTVETEKHHQNVAHERFIPSGPFAILPLTQNRCSLVWVEKSRLAGRQMGLDDAEFLKELGRRFGDFLGELRLTGPRWSYPLGLQFAQAAHKPRLVLIGDALHAMHPIAGQGLNMGLRDVATLAEILAESGRLGLDIADGVGLARYERWRRFDNLMMLAATDTMVRTFSNDIRPLRAARDLGLSVIGGIKPLKRLAMRHHMGTLGDLPRLLRGQPVL